MNLHVIQSEEARAEAKILMRVQEHILTPRYGGAVIGGIHDHISGAYLLTRGDTMVPKHIALEMLGRIQWRGDMPEEVMIDGHPHYRGHDLVGLIVPENVHLNFKSRSTDLVHVESGAIDGTLDKRAIGAEDGRLLDAIVQRNGPRDGASFLDQFTQLTIGACSSLGFTTGIDDEDLPPEAIDEIERINHESREKVREELEKFGKSGRGYEVRPGRTATLEENIMILLDQGKAEAGDTAKGVPPARTRSLGWCGRGLGCLRADERRRQHGTLRCARSMDNLTMMAGSIGQAKVRRKRLERGYHDRVLPHFLWGDRGSRQRGFIQSSFKRGLTPTEFFMLSVSGRESLVDTAVRTSKSGYMRPAAHQRHGRPQGLRGRCAIRAEHGRSNHPIPIW